jgi:hypothetical protein
MLDTMSVEGENNMASFVVRASNRRAIRHAVDLSCSVIREKDSTLTSLRAIDLSPDGMRVELYGLDVDLGDRFFVCFRSPDDSRSAPARATAPAPARGARRLRCHSREDPRRLKQGVLQGSVQVLSRHAVIWLGQSFSTHARLNPPQLARLEIAHSMTA